MPAVNPSPFSSKPTFVDPLTGAIANGYQLFTYVAGSVNTKLATYTDFTGTVANTNPIILDTAGQPNNVQLWLTVGAAYKFLLATPTDSDPPTNGFVLGDFLRGINDGTVNSVTNEWNQGPSASFVSTTQFAVSGDQTSIFQLDRRVQTINSGGTVYGTIIASVFAAGVTTVTITPDSGVLDAGLSLVSYGIGSATSPSEPYTGIQRIIPSAATINLDAAPNYSSITGTTTITSLTLTNGRLRTISFTGSLTLTNSGTLILPGGVNIATSSGDVAVFAGEASSVVRCVAYFPMPGDKAKIFVFTSGGTYTPSSTNVRSVIAEAVGGGGGSGGVAATGVGVVAAGAGGGGGGYSKKILPLLSVIGGVAVTVGAAGTAGASGGGTGGTGGTSSFGAFCSATGGIGGGGAAGVTPPNSQATGGNGGAGSSGDINVTGVPGGPSIALTGPLPGQGGASIFGGGGKSSASGAAVAGTSFGSGAAGPSNPASSSAQAGAAGTQGVVIVTEILA